MNNNNLVSMLGNLGLSLSAVQSLIAGLGYFFGILLVIVGIQKLTAVANSQGKMYSAIAYILGGAALIFLPSMLDTVSNSVFGVGNVLQYIPYQTHDIYSSMEMLIRTAGLIWFVRGCVLIMHGSEPGAKEGRKGLMFVFAGILAINFEGSMAVLNTILDKLMSLTIRK